MTSSGFALSSIFVLDNSVVMRWLFGDGKPAELDYAENVLDAMKEAKAKVPAVWGLEVANVIARAESRGLIKEARSAAFLEMLEELDIETDGCASSYALTDTLNLARRYGLSSYDASYLELSLRESLPLSTLDENLLKAAGKSGVKIFLP